MVGVNGVALTELAIHFNDSDFHIPGLDIIAGIEETVRIQLVFICHNSAIDLPRIFDRLYSKPLIYNDKSKQRFLILVPSTTQFLDSPQILDNFISLKNGYGKIK
jgi:hypothetical protein